MDATLEESSAKDYISEEILSAISWLYAFRKSGRPISVNKLVQQKEADSQLRGYRLDKRTLSQGLFLASRSGYVLKTGGKYSLTPKGFEKVGVKYSNPPPFYLSRRTMADKYRNGNIPRLMGEQ